MWRASYNYDSTADGEFIAYYLGGMCVCEKEKIFLHKKKLTNNENKKYFDFGSFEYSFGLV